MTPAACARGRRLDGDARRLGGPPARPRRGHLRRPARRARRRPGGLPRGGGAHALRNEFCVEVTARWPPRPEGNENPDLPTGEVEVIAELEVLSEAAPLPLPVDDQVEAGDDIRLKYRYLDLRRSGPAAGAAAALAGQPDRPRRAARARLPRDRDADADPVHPRGRPRLPGPGPAAARQLVRPAAVARSCSSSC